ncbi:TerD family protein [Chitinimonas koreensis]|uniref:TerD family protein n=1 Tax=Chitinimonas koreensis TaxID=356302 RepID=UPI000410D19A|nr:TerD family protein [Chitinimonas koreensis]QNM98178.1 TerD family protein [Chitinimonas koreensis]
MAIQLSKGQGINLSKSAPSLKRVRVGLGWDAPALYNGQPFDLDVSAFVCRLNAAGEPKLISDSHLVFYNNLATPNGAVAHSGDNRTGAGEGDDETLRVDLGKIDADAAEISFVVTLHEAVERRQSLGQISNAFIHLYDDATGALIAGYALDTTFSNETAVQFGSLFRKDGEWHFKAVGAGYRLSLGDFVAGYQ